MNNDDKLMGEAYGQISEGIIDRIKAKRGTGFASMGSKILSKAGKLAGDTRMGKSLTQAGQEGQMDVQEQRAQQLLNIYNQKLNKLYEGMKSDAQKIGVDIDSLAQQDYQSKGTGGKFPKLAGLSLFLRYLNQAKGVLGGE